MSRNRDAFFEKFPIISYNGSPALDILKRIDFNAQARSFISAFYPVQVDEGARVDNLAFDYYDSPDYDWLIYVANGIIDPYHGVSLSQNSFDGYIRSKYGSLRNAKRKTVWYETNETNDDTILSAAAYKSLSSDLKKFWDPITSPAGVIGYNRSNETLYASTNQISRLELQADTQVGTFEVGEYVSRDGITYGEVASVSTDELTIQHIEGNFGVGFPYTVTGDKSQATAGVAGFSVVVDVIPNDEKVYYKAVSAYDVEFDNNEKRREMFLVDRVYRDKVTNQLEEVLR